jgi:hypothetical protein
MGVDSTYGLQPDAKGRSATKLISKQTYNHGLFVVEINNMPGGICGTVPGCKFTQLTILSKYIVILMLMCPSLSWWWPR